MHGLETDETIKLLSEAPFRMMKRGPGASLTKDPHDDGAADAIDPAVRAGALGRRLQRLSSKALAC